MIRNNQVCLHKDRQKIQIQAPNLNIKRLGVVSRDYNWKFENGFRDFSHSFGPTLEILDRKGCDAVVFSSFSIIPRRQFSSITFLKKLKNIKAIFLEEFDDYPRRQHSRKVKRYVLLHCSEGQWVTYPLDQKFGSLTGLDKEFVPNFVRDELPKRIMGKCGLLLCGETNGVKYFRDGRMVLDIFGLRQALPPKVNVILNPVHDRMTRFEMRLKRQFLSENGRWVVSVWNKGKVDKAGRIRDGRHPAWTVFFDGKEVSITPIPNDLHVDIGVLNCH